MFGPSLFDEVLRLVKAWNPKGRCKYEVHYRDDLKEFLRTNLNKPSPFAIGPQRRIKVTPESRRYLCDIAVNESIGIELKKDFDKSKVDRLYGQLSRYKKGYRSGLIVVLVGNTNKDAYEDLVNRVVEMLRSTGISFGITTEQKIEIVNKGFTETRDTKPQGPYWVNPLTGKKEPLTFP